MKALAALVLALPLGAFAQGFVVNEHTACYSWNGGNHSSGSFIQCDTWKVVPAAPKAVPVAAPVAERPTLLTQTVCPPTIYLEPEPPKKAAPRKHRAPRPKCVAP